MSLQRKIKIATTIAVLTMLLSAISFSRQVLSSNLAQFKQTQSMWLSVYGQSLISDLKLGRTSSVSKKLNFLVRQGFFQSVRLESGAVHIREGKPLDPDLKNWFAPLLLDSRAMTIEIDLLDVDRSKWGTVYGELSPTIIFDRAINDSVAYLISIFGLLLIIMGFISLGAENLVQPIVHLTEKVRSKLSSDIPHSHSEVRQLELAIDAYQNDINSYKKIIEKQARMASLAEVAAQVSHDIRSPLSALGMVTAKLTNIPEEHRILIRNATARINDIANGLLSKKNAQYESIEDDEVPAVKVLQDHMLSTLIDTIVSEKRIEFRDQAKIEIRTDLSHSFGMFIRVDRTEISRAISNLINNAIESFKPDGGLIEVGIRSSQDGKFFDVVIQDNGCGIPEQVLDYLGKPGFTFGSKSNGSGSGLGIYQAKQAIADIGGELLISSKLGQGTTVILRFPRAAQPNWFVSELKIYKGSTVISVDDDPTIHDIWKTRLSPLLSSEPSIQYLPFMSLHDFESWLNQNSNETLGRALFLIDYEFFEASENGLEFIRKHQLEKQAVLVSSRTEEPLIQRELSLLGAKAVPKSIAKDIPILRA